jgi:diacylglycerol kinase
MGTKVVSTPEPFVASLHRRGFLAARWFSLRAAVAGVLYTLRTQPNAWIELAAAGVVVALGWWLEISRLEWAVAGLTIAVILALEAMNTAVEAVVDLVSPQAHPLAKTAKDAAAGAMVLAVLGSLWVAGFIFGPRLWALLF